jgi:hypothetical protein
MAEFETAQQWEDQWWAEVERARRMAPTDDGDAAARVAWTCMRARYGTPPPYAAAVVDARPYPRDVIQGHPDALIVARVVNWMANGHPVELDRSQADALLAHAGVGTCEHTRRGWLGRLLDRVFG